MSIIEFLKRKRGKHARVACGIRWLVWNKARKMWSVYEKQIYGGEGLLLISTADEAVAIEILEDNKC